MKYLIKPFRLLVGIFLIISTYFWYLIGFICLFIWYLNPKKCYYILKRDFKYSRIYSWGENVVFYDGEDVECEYRNYYYKTLIDFMNNKVTSINDNK